MTKPKREHSTIRSIAQYVQLSPTTVSLALRGDGSIPAETRNRILMAARELNYTYVSRRKNPQDQETYKHIVYVVKDYGDHPAAANPFYGQVLSGVEQACQEQNAKLGFVALPHDYPNEEELPLALTHNVDGIILSSPYPRETLDRVAQTSGCPVVLVDNTFPASPYDTVMVDDFGGAYQATQHLLQLGHSKIKVIMGRALSLNVPPSFQERYRGYCAACEETGIQPVAPAILPTEIEQMQVQQDRHERYREWLASIRDAEPELTAFFCVNDLYAINAIHGLQWLGARVPEECSVVGFDDQNMSGLITPPLTTIRSYKRTMGMLAVKQLLSRLSGDTMPAVHITVGTDLIVRASTSPLGNTF